MSGDWWLGRCKFAETFANVSCVAMSLSLARADICGAILDTGLG